MRYNEYYPSSLTEGLGLISGLSTIIDIPWHGDVDIANIEMAFALSYGDHTIRPTFLKLTGENQIKTVAKMFSQKWNKLWNIYRVEYNMLDAYIVNESGNDSKDKKSTKTRRHGHTVTDETTNRGTVDIDIGNTETTLDSVYAFNSPELAPTPSSESRGTSHTDNLETRNLSSNTVSTHGGEDSDSIVDEESGKYTITKTGNIGYSTPQEMLKQELELWGEPFFKQVFMDISRFIFIQVY